MWETEEYINVEDFDIRAMIDDTILDMEVLAEFIEDIMGFDSSNDDKIRELKRILREDPRANGKKIIIFSEYRATAKYIFRELVKDGFDRIEDTGKTGHAYQSLKKFRDKISNKSFEKDLEKSDIGSVKFELKRINQKIQALIKKYEKIN